MEATPEPVGPNAVRAELDDANDLILYCRGEAFARLRDLLAAEAENPDALPADPDVIQSVLLARDEPVPDTPPADPAYAERTWLDLPALFGCLAGMVAVFAVFCIGVVTVARWCFG